jgi:hypothetical protein
MDFVAGQIRLAGLLDARRRFVPEGRVENSPGRSPGKAEMQNHAALEGRRESSASIASLHLSLMRLPRVAAALAA